MQKFEGGSNGIWMGEEEEGGPADSERHLGESGDERERDEGEEVESRAGCNTTAILKLLSQGDGKTPERRGHKDANDLTRGRAGTASVF